MISISLSTFIFSIVIFWIIGGIVNTIVLTVNGHRFKFDSEIILLFIYSWGLSILLICCWDLLKQQKNKIDNNSKHKKKKVRGKYN